MPMDHKMPMTPSRSVSHAAFSYCGRYCAITFQSIAVPSFCQNFRSAGPEQQVFASVCALSLFPGSFPVGRMIYPFS